MNHCLCFLHPVLIMFSTCYWCTYSSNNTTTLKLTETEWHIYASVNYTIIGSDNGLLPGRHQAIIWTNDGILLIGPLGTNFSEIIIKIQTFSFKKIHLKMSSGKCLPFCLGLNVFNKKNKKNNHQHEYPILTQVKSHQQGMYKWYGPNDFGTWHHPDDMITCLPVMSSKARLQMQGSVIYFLTRKQLGNFFQNVILVSCVDHWKCNIVVWTLGGTINT